MTRTGHQVDFRGAGTVSRPLHGHFFCDKQPVFSQFMLYLYLSPYTEKYFFLSKKAFDDFDTERAYVTRT